MKTIPATILLILIGFITLPICQSVHDRASLTAFTPSFSRISPYQEPDSVEINIERTVGGQNITILLVYFTDTNPEVSNGTIFNLVNISLNNYFKEVSYGKLYFQNIKGYNWQVLARPMSYYAKDREQLVSDALKHSPKGSISDYDRVIIVHAGDDRAITQDKDDIWSFSAIGYALHQTSTGTAYIGVSVVAESDPLGVYAHEFGHMLGLPDIYSLEGQPELVGIWDLMALGTSAGKPKGSRPTHPTSWSKTMVEWMTEGSLIRLNMTDDATVTLESLERPSEKRQVAKIPLTKDTYYLAELRLKIGFDSSLPSEGLLILYVDESESGYGALKVVDTHPDTDTLNDAPLKRGERFEDSAMGIAVSVISSTSNSYEIRIQFKKIIDLRISEIWIKPQTPIATQPIAFYINITNSGNRDCSEFTLHLYLDEKPYLKKTVSLPAGASNLMNIEDVNSILPGEHIIKAILDEENLIFESDESNNIAQLRFTVNLLLMIYTSNPDLHIQMDESTYKAEDGLIAIVTSPGKHKITIESPIEVDSKTRQIFTEWSDGAIENPREIYLGSNTKLAVSFKTQYLLTVKSDDGSYDLSEWQFQGSMAEFSIPYIFRMNESSRRVLEAYRIDDGPLITISNGKEESVIIMLIMDSPHTVQVSTKVQHYLSVILSHLHVIGEGWYDEGAEAVVRTESMLDFKNDTRIIFNGYGGDFSSQDSTIRLLVDSPKLVSVLDERQYRIIIYFYDNSGKKRVYPDYAEFLGSKGYTFTSTDESGVWLPSDIYTPKEIVWQQLDVKPENYFIAIKAPGVFGINLRLYDMKIKVVDMLSMPVSWATIRIGLTNGRSQSYRAELDGSTTITTIPLGVLSGEATFLGQTSSFQTDASIQSNKTVRLTIGPFTLALISVFVITLAYFAIRRR